MGFMKNNFFSESALAAAKEDKDLYPILQFATKAELEQLAKIIADKTSAYISSDEKDPVYIAAEIQLFGGDSIVNTVRRRGISYREIVKDVAKSTGVELTPDAEIHEFECAIVKKTIEKFKASLNEEELELFEQEVAEQMDERSPALVNAGFLYRDVLLNIIISTIAARMAVMPALGLVGFAAVLFAFSSPAYKIIIPLIIVIAEIRPRVTLQVEKIQQHRETELLI